MESIVTPLDYIYESAPNYHNFAFLPVILCKLSNMRQIYHLALLLACLQASDTFTLKRHSFSTSHWKCESMLDDSIDISPDSPGAVLKRVIRTGDSSSGYPVVKDTVTLAWEIRLKDGTVAHKSNSSEEPFSFILGAEPREVILGWELCVPTMAEGEVASLVIKPSHAFGVKGVPPMIPPNETVICQLELVSITPSIQRAYKSVGINESIKDELLEKIQAGDSMISNEVMGINSANLVNGTKTKENIKMFDEKTMTLDPNQRISGEGRGHCWEETPRTMDVEVAIPAGTKKADIQVEFEPSQIRVTLKNGMEIIQGPLHGKISPSECMWATAEHDPKSRIKGEKLVLSLEKSFGHRDIWATVFDRNYLKANQKEGSMGYKLRD